MSLSERHQAVALEEIRQRLNTTCTELADLVGWFEVEATTGARELERVREALQLVERVRAQRHHPTVTEVVRPVPSRIIKIRSDEEAI